MELGHVNVFIGANGSGKSNLLEALGVLSAAANGKVDEQALLARGGVVLVFLSSTNLPSPLRLEHEFLPICVLKPMAHKQNTGCPY